MTGRVHTPRMGPSRRVPHLPFDPDRSYMSAYREFFFRAFADRLRGRVLDLGAGGTEASHTYRAHSDSIDEYVAVDRNSAPDLDVVADGSALPFDEGAFEAVVLSSVLEHVPPSSLFDVLGEVRRVLRPDGYALAHLPFIYPLHAEPNDYARYTPHGLRDIFETAGFADVDVYRGGSYVEVLLQSLYMPFSGVLNYLGLGSLRSAFAGVHYPTVAAAEALDRVVETVYGDNVASEPWHLESFVVAR